MEARGCASLLERGLCPCLPTCEDAAGPDAALNLREAERCGRLRAAKWQGVSGGVRRGVHIIPCMLLHIRRTRGRSLRVVDNIRLACVKGEHGSGVRRRRRRASRLGGRPHRRRRRTRGYRVRGRRGELQHELLAVVHGPRRTVLPANSAWEQVQAREPSAWAGGQSYIDIKFYSSRYLHVR